MHHRERAAALLAAWLVTGLLLASCGPAPTPTAVPARIPVPTDTPTPTPAWPPLPALAAPRVQAPEWEGAAVEVICVEVIEAGEPLGLSDEVTEVARRLLTDVGLQVAAEGQVCDATLTISLEGTPLSGQYEGLGTCYTGAKLEGEMTLAAPGLETLTLPISSSDRVEGGITWSEGSEPPCAPEPEGAPFGRIWQRDLLDNLMTLWGPRLLVPALWDGNNRVASVAKAELRGRGAEEEVVLFLIHLLTDTRSWMRGLAAESLGEIGPPAKQAIPYLIHTVAASDPDVAESALQALAAIAREDVGPDAASWEQWWADVSPRIEALEESEPDVATLAESLDDPVTLVACTAAHELVQMGPDAAEAMPALVAALDREDVELRLSVVHALGNMVPDAIPGLVQALGDDEEAVVRAAAEHLGQMGPEALEAVPALIQCLGHLDGAAEVWCHDALMAITGEDFDIDAERWLQWWEEER